MSSLPIIPSTTDFVSAQELESTTRSSAPPDEAIARAQAAGVKCVQNDCIFREHSARPEPHVRE